MENSVINKISDGCVEYNPSLDTHIREFYTSVFETRWEKTFNIFRWLNRYGYYSNHNAPYLQFKNDRLITHVGAIPEDVMIEGRKYKLSFVYDFISCKELRGRGLTKSLYRYTMQQSDILVAYTNENSGKLSKFFGFQECYNSNFISFDTNSVLGYRYMPKSILYPLRKVMCGLKYNYYKYSHNSRCILERINSDNIKSFYNTENFQTDEVNFVKDKNYFGWRIFESPNFEQYRIFKCTGCEDTQLLIRLTPSGDIMILMTSNNANIEKLKKSIASLCVWAIDNGYLSIDYYTTNSELANILIKSFNVKRYNNPQFIFYSKHKVLIEKLKQAKWNIELINSDFEFFTE